MMNRFSIDFYPVIPVWLTILLFILAFYFCFGVYKVKNTSKWTPFLLQTLRFLSISILILLLQKPTFNALVEIKTIPKIALLIDNSESMTIKNGKYDGERTYKEILNSFKNWDSTKVKTDLIAFGGTITQKLSLDSIQMNQKDTDLFNVISSVVEKDAVYSAAILISDGNYTLNRDPIFAAENSAFPIHTIAVGDTIAVRDMSIKSVSPPVIAYSKVPFQVTYRIQRSGYVKKQDVYINVIEKGRRIQRIKRTFQEAQTILSDTLSLASSEVGLLRWKLEIEPSNDEYTQQNNKMGFAVRIIENKTKIAHIAFGIHPDVKTVRSIIGSMQNVRLFPFNWITQNTFDKILPENLSDSVNLFIIHGFPHMNVPNSLRNKMISWTNDKPTIWLTLPTQDNGFYNASLLENQPLQMNQQIPYLDSEVRFNENELNHPILDLPEINLSSFTVKAKQRSIQAQQRAKILLSFMYRGVDLNVPGLAVLQIANKRMVQFAFYDFYKLYQDGDEKRAFIEKLIQNCVEWASTTPEQNLVELNLPDREINENDTFELRATFKNESLQPIINGNLTAKIFDSNTLVSSINLPSNGDGTYKKVIGPFSDGIYSVELSGAIGDQILDKDKGTFSVSSISNEFRSIERNDQVLSNIAYVTNAEAHHFDDASEFINQIYNTYSSQEKIESVKKEVTLNTIWAWLAILSCLLTIEWIIRKWLALR